MLSGVSINAGHPDFQDSKPRPEELLRGTLKAPIFHNAQILSYAKIVRRDTFTIITSHLVKQCITMFFH